MEKIEIYRWQDDDEADEAIRMLRERGIPFEEILLDAECPQSTPGVAIDDVFIGESRDLLRRLRGGSTL